MDIDRIHSEAMKRPIDDLLKEARAHLQNAREGFEPLGSVRVAMLLLEVVQRRLADEAARGN